MKCSNIKNLNSMKQTHNFNLSIKTHNMNINNFFRLIYNHSLHKPDNLNLIRTNHFILNIESKVLNLAIQILLVIAINIYKNIL